MLKIYRLKKSLVWVKSHKRSLYKWGLLTCQDVQQSSQTVIYQEFGKFGQRLWDFCHGIDIREVEVDRPRKSLAVENTLLQDINTLAQAELIIDELYHKLLFRIQRNWADTPLHEFKKLGIKLKFEDFNQTTIERTTDGLEFERFRELLHQVWARRNERNIRLIGLNVHFPSRKITNQLNLWE